MSRKRHPGNYKKLAKELEKRGYRVKKEIFFDFIYHNQDVKYNRKKPLFTFWRFTGRGIYGGFCTPNKNSYLSLRGHITADNIECFDKWSKCPLRMKIQTLDYEKLFKELELLGSPEGFEISNNFDEHRVFTYEQVLNGENDVKTKP